MSNAIINKVSDTLDSKVLQYNPDANAEKSERLVSIGAGAFITLKGITNVFSHPFLALAELGIGGTLLYRGLTGYCAVKDKLEDHEFEGPNVPVSERALPTEIY